MKFLSLLVAVAYPALICNAAEPLTVERLKEIADAEHEDKLDEPALKIYPKAREYEITITSKQADGQIRNEKITATEKWVAARYIVSEPRPNGSDSKFTMIVEFDRDSSRFRKYILLDGKLTGYSEGAKVSDSRSVSWIDLSRDKFASDIDIHSIETHTDTSTNWTSFIYRHSKFQYSETGAAKVTKP